MKTILHYYLCDLTKMEGIRECKRIQRETRGVPETIGTPSLDYWQQIIKLNGQLVELPEGIYPKWFEGLVPFVDRFECGHLFTHFRFDHKGKPIAEGYYLEMTDEIIEARDNTYRCPCCYKEGRNINSSLLGSGFFCQACIPDIENERDLYKTFYRPVSVIDVQPKNVLIPSEVKQYWIEHHKALS